MERFRCILISLVLVTSCNTTKRAINAGPDTIKKRVAVEVPGDSMSVRVENNVEEKEKSIIPDDELSHSLINPIINTALSYSGTRYKYGGTTKGGMDCSGLIYMSFLEHDIPLQRASYRMAEQGILIKLSQIKKGDLLFFSTGKRRKKVNHVGLVVAVDQDQIKFIHATSSRGVTISSLRDGYWNSAFLKAKRILK